jgi:hypothetical protein
MTPHGLRVTIQGMSFSIVVKSPHDERVQDDLRWVHLRVENVQQSATAHKFSSASID